MQALYASIERKFPSILRSMSKRPDDRQWMCEWFVIKKKCSDQKRTVKWQRWLGHVAAGTGEKEA